MGHALKEIWRVLTPGGSLIDLRPLAARSPVQVVTGEQHPDARILPMTGLLTQLWSADELSKLLDAERTLTKPITPDEIVSAVRDAL